MRTLLFATCLVAVAAPVALAKPPGPAPKAPGAPPPAWLEKSGTDRWLAFSSFCWTTTCVDYLPPNARPDLPRLAVAAGTLVRFHLGFNPTSVELQRFGTSRKWRLPAARVSAWRVPSRGIYVLAVRADRGSASYVFRIV